MKHDIQNQSMNDQLQAALKNGLSWGDLILSTPASEFFCDEPKPLRGCLEDDWDWEMPLLSLRKDIWYHFPVTVTETKSGSYAIRWHRKNYLEARENVDHFFDYLDFEENTYRRLLKALNASRYWTVGPAQDRDDLCVITMNASEKADESMFVKPTKTLVLPSKSLEDDGWEQVGAKVPVLKRLNDIKVHFPVVWRAVEGAKVSTYSLELHGKTLKEKGLNAKEVKTDLLKALRLSTSWTVKAATNDKEVCQIEMRC
jgi:hypothetical protein